MVQRMNDLDPKLLVLFAKVVRLNGVSRAARVLSMPKATISRGLSRLEESLGARLFERSSRGMRLTKSGERIYLHCQRVAEEVEEAKAAIGSTQNAISDQLRIASPLTFGRSLLSPVLPRFLTRHPQLRVEVELTNRRVDPAEENFDLVIRLGPLADSALVAKPLGAVHFAVCASPCYLKSRAAIERPEDLSRHAVIDLFDGAERRNWAFTRDGEEVKVEVVRRLDTNDPIMRREAAVAGLGIGASGPGGRGRRCAFTLLGFERDNAQVKQGERQIQSVEPDHTVFAVVDMAVPAHCEATRCISTIKNAIFAL